MKYPTKWNKSDQIWYAKDDINTKISSHWMNWFKQYTHRSIRRRNKQRCKIIRNSEDY